LTSAAKAYLGLPADSRLEVRIPALLKQHAEAVAAARSEKLSELVLEAVAEKVAEELAEARSWHLTVDEQRELLRVLSSPGNSTPALKAAEERARELFGAEAIGDGG
jgi:uncharacterized protein (DUF1778 family)